MATKSKSKPKKQYQYRPPVATTPAVSTIDPRKELLVRVAGRIAAQLVASPSQSIASAPAMAMVAVDIAEEILKKAGIPVTAATAPVAEEAAPSSSATDAAAS